MEESAQEVGRRAERSDTVDRFVRIGMVVYGVLHLVVAWLAVEVALGHSAGKVSSQGAFHQLAQAPVGKAMLLAFAAGMALMVVWQGLEAFAGHADRSGVGLWFRRIRSGVTAVTYTVLVISAVKVVLGSGSSSSSSSGAKEWTARLMDLPLGQWLVFTIGLVLVAVGVGMSWHSLGGGYAGNLAREGRRGETGRLYLFFGRAGYLAKGLLTLLVGLVIGYAAVTHDPHKSGGLDQAVHDLAHAPFGRPLLIALAVGVACYGLFCFARSRHLSR